MSNRRDFLGNLFGTAAAAAVLPLGDALALPPRHGLASARDNPVAARLQLWLNVAPEVLRPMLELDAKIERFHELTYNCRNDGEDAQVRAMTADRSRQIRSVEQDCWEKLQSILLRWGFAVPRAGCYHGDSCCEHYPYVWRSIEPSKYALMTKDEQNQLQSMEYWAQQTESRKNVLLHARFDMQRCVVPSYYGEMRRNPRQHQQTRDWIQGDLRVDMALLHPNLTAVPQDLVQHLCVVLPLVQFASLQVVQETVTTAMVSVAEKGQ